MPKLAVRATLNPPFQSFAHCHSCLNWAATMVLDPAVVHDDKSIPPPGWNKRMFARFMHAYSPKAAHRLEGIKSKLFANLTKQEGVADVAEIGMGTAPNLKFYAANVDTIVGIDFNAAMQPFALESAAQAGVEASKLQLVVGKAEALPLPDACVDAVVATHLFCSVEDVPRSMSEILRVLKPGGRYIFLEHVAAGPHSPYLRNVQCYLTPAWSLLADGCCLNRDTLAQIEAAGFSKVEAEHLEIQLPWLGRILAPHVAGVAFK